MEERSEIDVEALKLQEQQRGYQETQITDEFVQEHMSMIEAIASKIVRSGKKPSCVEFEDLVSWGVEGLIKAHGNFKSDKGSSFKTYAYYRIRGEMYDRIRQEWSYRNPSDYQSYRQQIQDRIAEVIDDQISSEEGSPGAPSPKAGMDLISMASMTHLMSIDNITDTHGALDPKMELVDKGYLNIQYEISQLEEDERQLIELFYLEDMSQKEIAEKLKKSRSKVCRMHMKVLEKLKRRLTKYEELS